MTAAAPPQHKRADIQGLRAVAVLSVVVYHAYAPALPGGFVGVDIFFVISGFLITGILARELDAGAMSIAGFYQRRVKRLFPALFTMLTAVMLAGWVLLAPNDFAELARTAISTVFFVSNFHFYSLNGYFDGASADKPLLHTWSLAVEEQFYILFPLFLALIWRFARKHAFAIMVVVFAVSLTFGAWGAWKHATAAFYLAPFRVFELALGAVVALAPRLTLGGATRNAMTLLGAALIAAALALYNDHIVFPGLAAFVPCLGVALIIYAGLSGSSFVAQTLSLAPLTFFGAISYSLYLWHWPLLSFGRHYVFGALTAPQAFALAGVAVVLAAASWRFIEEPVLNRRWSKRAVFTAGAVAMALSTAFAAFVSFTHGFPQRFPPRAQELFAAADDFNHRRDECHGDEDKFIPYAQNCLYGAPGVEPVVAVWGDSAGTELVVALGEALAKRGQAVMQVTSSACPPALDYAVVEKPSCPEHSREALEHLAADARIHTVILTTNFSRYLNPDLPRMHAGMERAVETLTRAGKIVVIAEPFPNPWFLSPEVLGMKAARNEPLDTVGVPRALFEADNRDALVFVRDLAARYHARIFRPADAICRADFCPSYAPQWGVIYWNGNHISVSGARLAVTAFPFDTIPPPAR